MPLPELGGRIEISDRPSPAARAPAPRRSPASHQAGATAWRPRHSRARRAGWRRPSAGRRSATPTVVRRARRRRPSGCRCTENSREGRFRPLARAQHPGHTPLQAAGGRRRRSECAEVMCCSASAVSSGKPTYDAERGDGRGTRRSSRFWPGLPQRGQQRRAEQRRDQRARAEVPGRAARTRRPRRASPAGSPRR